MALITNQSHLTFKGEKVNKKQFAVLHHDYSLKCSISEKTLFNLTNGIMFVLDDDQYELLIMLDGKTNIEKILQSFSQNSRQAVMEFLEMLSRENIIITSNKPSKENINKNCVPDHRLQAVHLEARSICNLRCAHCYQGGKYSEENLTLGEIDSLAEQMNQLQVQGISISGGEPFVQDDLFEIVKFFESRNIRIISFFTNSLLLDDNKILSLSKLLENMLGLIFLGHLIFLKQ